MAYAIMYSPSAATDFRHTLLHICQGTYIPLAWRQWWQQPKGARQRQQRAVLTGQKQNRQLSWIMLPSPKDQLHPTPTTEHVTQRRLGLWWLFKQMRCYVFEHDADTWICWLYIMLFWICCGLFFQCYPEGSLHCLQLLLNLVQVVLEIII